MPPPSRSKWSHSRLSLGQLVLELSEFDLRSCDLRPGAPREDVENEFGPVDDLDLGRLLDLSPLRRPEVVVEDQEVCLVHLGGRLDALHHPTTYVRLPVQARAVLNEAVDDHRSGRSGQLGEFVERLVFVLDPRVREADAHQDGSLVFRYEFPLNDRPPGR